jgi:cytochrome P450 family 71 subfamily A
METPQTNELFAGFILVLVTNFLIKLLLPASSNKRRTASPSLPRPRGFPIIGNLHQLGTLPHNNLAALSTRLGAPLMLLRLGSVPALVVSTADALRAAFQPNDRAMSGRPAPYAATRITYGLQDNGFSHPDGAFWRAARRALLSELLGAPRVRGFRGVREGEAAALVAAVTDLSSAGSAVNLSGMIMATSNMIVRRVAFGDDGEGSIEAGVVLEETQYLLGAFFVADYIPWLGWLDALRGLRRRLERNFRDLDAIYERVIDEHMKKRDVSKEQDMVDVLLRLHGDAAHGTPFCSRSQLKGILTVGT